MTVPIMLRCRMCQHFEGQIVRNNYDSNKNFNSGDEGVNVMIYFCPAFPMSQGGIPKEILYWENPHVEVRDDQIGAFTFKPKGLRK